MKSSPNNALQPTANESGNHRAKEHKHSFNWGWVVWPLVVLFLYVASVGPVAMLVEKGHLSNQFGGNLYGPVRWAYIHTPLHKPLGMYYHLWVPMFYDKNGEYISQ